MGGHGKPEQLWFLARVDRQHRVTIQSAVREVLDIKPGEYLYVFVRRLSKTSPEGPPPVSGL